MPRRRNVLVVVDIQPQFVNEDHPVIGSAASVARKLSKNGWLVIVLEYAGTYYADQVTFRPTFKQIIKACRRKPLLIRKFRDGGGDHVRFTLDERDIRPLSFTVVGVNTNACVYSTVKELAAQYCDVPIVVVKWACAAENATTHERGLEKIREIGKNVKIA